MDRIKATSEDTLRGVILALCEDDESTMKRISENIRLIEQIDSHRDRPQKRKQANDDADDDKRDATQAVKLFKPSNPSETSSPFEISNLTQKSNAFQMSKLCQTGSIFQARYPFQAAASTGAKEDTERGELEKNLAQAEVRVTELEATNSGLNAEVSQSKASMKTLMETYTKKLGEEKAKNKAELEQEKAKNEVKLEQEKAKLRDEYESKLQRERTKMAGSWTCQYCGKAFDNENQISPSACAFHHPGAFQIRSQHSISFHNH